MANDLHLDNLLKGTEARNQWLISTAPRSVWRDGADFTGVSLVNANLRNALLNRANFEGANLEGADFGGANLKLSNLKGIRCSNANLLDASLDGANLESSDFFRSNVDHCRLPGAIMKDASLNNAILVEADLSGADLSSARLLEANVTGANLVGANFSGAHFGGTNLAYCYRLSKALGLQAISHNSPSYLDAVTLRGSLCELPDVFLQGVGYSVEEVETLKSLYGQAFYYYSCFISYTHADADFATRLHSDLQVSGVSCWKDDIDLKGRDYWQPQINEAIRLQDKTVLICSERSLSSDQVVREILKSMEIQRTNGIRNLFPIRIDDYVFSDDFARFAEVQVATGEWAADWLPKIRAFHIADFRGWKNHDKYIQALERLVKDLKKQQMRVTSEEPEREWGFESGRRRTNYSSQ